MSGFSRKSLGLFSCRQVCGGARWMIHVFSLVCLTLSTASCGWVKPRADAYKDSKEYSETEFRKAEPEYYKNKSSATPQFCVALSGGGIRAAAYSIGVLKGLHETGKVHDVDIISAVSGGSYAATWFYDQYRQKVSSGAGGLNGLKNVLSRTSIEKVAEKVANFNLFQGLQAIGNVAEGTDPQIFQAVMEGGVIQGGAVYGAGLIGSIFPPWKDKHETQSGSDYENNIGTAFQTEPDPEKRLSLQGASPDLPYLIVNATIQGVPKSQDTQLANDILEFTSHGMGSPSIGYKSWAGLKPNGRADKYSLSRVASISGAAVDKSTFNIKGFKILWIFGRDIGLGYAMLSPTYDGEVFRRFLVLTDGGHSENLGVYGLIKRDCKEILVVDAEYDGGITNLNKAMYDPPIEGYQDGYSLRATSASNKS